MKVLILFPTTLFEFEDAQTYDRIYVVEEPKYFTAYPFHKSKLVLHRASMKAYASLHKNVEYVSFNKVDYKRLLKSADSVACFDPIDHELRAKIKSANKHVTFMPSPSMLTPLSELLQFKKQVKRNQYRHDVFYKWQRRRMNVLMDGNDEPLYGKWSFDTENRKPFSKEYKAQKIAFQNDNKFVSEAKLYVDKHFGSNFGTHDNFCYPVTHGEAQKQLKRFVKQALLSFGPTQDAVGQHIPFGSHSVLSSCLNIGLLTPRAVLDAVLEEFNGLERKKEVIASVEGFIRQLIGWREYVRMLYEFHGPDMLRMNALKHERKLGQAWFSGTTGLEPIDHLIKKVHDYAYLHHIERLMYVGNFALLMHIHPKQVYDWFMICFIDSYEWVMVANVMGMSQYALTGMAMMTKPYFSSSNYLLKMSDYKKGEWCRKWDALYYAFIDKHKTKFAKIYSIAPHVKRWTEFPQEKKEQLLKLARTLI